MITFVTVAATTIENIIKILYRSNHCRGETVKVFLFMEVWKDIKGYEGIYQISNLGRVKSLARKGVLKDKVLKCFIDSQRYLRVNLYKNSTRLGYNIHKLVAIAFLGHTPCGHKIEVDHINGIKTDNRVKNLQLLTNREHQTKTAKDIDKTETTSKYTGVSWHKSKGKWRSQIKINGKLKHLGYFTDELEASNAYQKALDNL
tara:strand:- start:59 stop:664 length:606 start_codon:yes stop_codon:yes gene_type:complete